MVMKSLFTTKPNSLLHRRRTDVASVSSDGGQVPFTFDPLLQPRIVVQVLINGQAPLPFWIDTGLNTGVIIDAQVAAALRLMPQSGAPEINLGAIRARRTDLTSLSFVAATSAEVASENVSATISPTDIKTDIKTAMIGDITILRPNLTGQSVAGLIGIKALCRSAVRLDFVTGMMTLNAPTPEFPHLRTACLPMHQSVGDGRYFVLVGLPEGATAELLIDTGAEGTGIPMAVAQHLHSLRSKAVGMATAYGMSISPMLLLPSLSLGECVLERVAVVSLPHVPSGYPLGIDLLARFCVTLDFPQRRLYLQRPTPETIHPRLDGYTGIDLVEQDGEFRVAAVEGESPAHQIGIVAGDTVKRIDGLSLEGLSFLAARRLVNGFAGTWAELEMVAADGRCYAGRLTRRSEFSRPALPIEGLFLRMPAQRPMEVIGALPGCPGDQAGLQPGDIVMEFNGHLTATISTETLAVEFRQPRLTLKIRRGGAETLVTISIAVTQSDSETQADGNAQ
jgi:predicted aspartyl protease